MRIVNFINAMMRNGNGRSPVSYARSVDCVNNRKRNRKRSKGARK